jgi:fucose permease
MSAFFWGNAALQLPIVHPIRRLGAKRSVMIMIILSIILTFLFVPAASYGWQFAFAARLLLGLSQVLLNQ